MSSQHKSWNQRGKLTWLLLAAWAIVLIIGIASLSVRHLAALPKPTNNPFLIRAILKYRRNPATAFLVHVIDAQCSCSSGLLTHLLTRRPFANQEELILFVGTDQAKQQLIRKSNFEYQSVSSSQLVDRFGLEAAPILLIFDRDGKLRYAGGYYDRPAAVDPLDVTIYKALSAGAPVEGLPVFGCAISPRLQKAISPLRFLPKIGL